LDGRALADAKASLPPSSASETAHAGAQPAVARGADIAAIESIESLGWRAAAGL
jgi:hypothetical protein